MITNLEYDVPVEVSKEQFLRALNRCSGLVAGREENGKYYIKLWVTKHKNFVLKVLNE